MAKRDTFITIRTEGALLPPDLLQQIAFGTGIDGLSPESYHLAGERLNEAVTRAWNRMLGAWANFKSAREKLADSDAGTTITRERWLMPLFQELGYGRLQTSRAYEIEGKTYHISHMWEGTPIHLITFRADLDTRLPGTVGASRMSPHGMMQEFLNRTDEHLWAFLSNGLRLRILRDNSSLTRQAYLEFDIEAMMEGEVYADFALLWLLCHQSRVEGDKPEECWLEKWSRFAQETGKRVMEKFRVSVEEAIATLGAGFIACPANRELRDNLRVGTVDRQDYYRQVLRVVYRLIFLFVAEDRDVLLLPEAPQQAKDTYTKYYSTARLRRLAEKRRGTPHVDLMRGLWLLFDKLGNDGCPEIGLPALGSFLWSNDAVAEIAGCDISNKDLLAAIHRLAFTVEDNVRRPVDYRNLGSEELGSVYESLLELHPEMNLEAGTFVLRTAGGNDRKTTGSYYTPPSLIDCLLDSALDPVLNDACKKPNPQEAVLDLKIVDPACGSGHFLVRAAHRVAKRLAALRTGDDEPSPEAVRRALRDVIGRCIYGVDINPMSVELCKVSLWMESLEPGKPLSFLDHHIQCGNSLLGVLLPSQVEAAKAEIERQRQAKQAQIEELRIPAARDRELDKERKRLMKELNGLRYVGYPESIPDEAFTPLEGDVKDICTIYRKQNAQEREQGGLFTGDMQPWQQLGDLAAAVTKIEDIDDGDIAGVRRKQRLYEELRRSDRAHSGCFLADAWCAAFVWKKVDRDSYPITHQVFTRIMHNPHDVPAWMREEIDRLSAQYQFFHWHIAFPEVFSPLAGTAGGVVQGVEVQHDPRPSGFDIVLGNPPWDMQEVKDNEFFASSYPEILAVASAKDKERIFARIEAHEPILWGQYQGYVRKTYGERLFLMESKRYPLSAVGRMNLYRLFLETGQSALTQTGRLGMVIPSGFASDSFSQEHFGQLHGSGQIASFFDFENREGIFPGVHRSQKFCLITITGRNSIVRESDFVFYARSVTELSLRERHVPMSQDDLRKINPLTLTAPLFQSRRDQAITLFLQQQAPILVDPAEAGWQVKPTLMFMMNASMKTRRTANELEAEGYTLMGNRYIAGEQQWLPFYEGKMVGAYDHRAASIIFEESNRVRRNQPVDTIISEHEDPEHAVLPMFWLDSVVVKERCGEVPRWCLVVKDVTSATNERTAISAVLPSSALSDSLPWLSNQRGACVNACLLANLNTFVLDYVARQKVAGLHLRGHYLSQLPIFAPDVYSNICSWAHSDYAAWFVPRVMELTYTAWDMHSFACDCGYDGPPFRWNENRRFLLRCEIDAAFFQLYGITRDDVGYIMETFPIVKRKDEAQYGEFRTKRVILGIYDAMAEAIRTGIPYQTILDPLPADPRVAHAPAPVVIQEEPYHEEQPRFPWPGRERFARDYFRHLVTLRPGQTYEYYMDALVLATRPDLLRALLPDGSRPQFDDCSPALCECCVFPDDQRLRPLSIRQHLVREGRIVYDLATHITSLGDNVSGLPALDQQRGQLFTFALEAADALHQAMRDASPDQKIIRIVTTTRQNIDAMLMAA